MPKRSLPHIYYNWMSIFGAFIALVAVLLILLFFGISMLFEFASNPYLGIIQFLILPIILFLGLLCIPLGAYRVSRRIRKGKQARLAGWPIVDLNQRLHRNAAVTFALGSVIVIFLSAVGGYQAFHYTKSVDFCGKICHEVMKPEHVAYQNSPHARVPCAACHIGTGADWFVRSKLSGVYQVYAVLSNNYSRPIPTPIENLRPAQETCEKCHWPDKFFGAQEIRFNHYMYDENNTHWSIDVLMKTGGGDPKTGQAHGIHWHMNIGFKVEYIARDVERQDIPWVRATDLRTGRVTVYKDTENPLAEEGIRATTPRVMDCMDCHNRPSHVHNSPDHAIDMALLTEQVDITLPQIKRVAVEAMAADYKTEDEALHGIATFITEFYQTEYPELYKEKKDIIDATILAVQGTFSQNIFPEMGVRWTQYPSNLGHFYSIGCMRCHNSSLASDKGIGMTTECTSCHTILSQGSGATVQMASSEEGLEFVHPEDIDEAWREMGCYECHTGEQP